METFCEWPFSSHVGTTVRCIKEKEAWLIAEGNCRKLWWWLCGPMPLSCLSSQVSVGQERTDSGFGASVAHCRPSNGVAAPLDSPCWSDCFDVSLQYVLFVLFGYITFHNSFLWTSSLVLFPL